MTMKMNRRGLLGTFASLGGGLLLRSLATGIPAKILLDPLSARAEDAPTGKTLILVSSSQGDPLNANVPGTYEYGPEECFHSPDPAMAKTNTLLGEVPAVAAKPWANLKETTRARLAFFHHATYTPVHGEFGRVQKLMNATEKSDMLLSLVARELAPVLGSVQSDPVSLGASGGELLSARGRILGNVSPTSVRQALGGDDGPLKDLTSLRDAQMDRMYALYREQGTPTQLALLDAWARSRDDVRSISGDLLSRLANIEGDDQANQITCAAVLAAMNIAPVLTVHVDFGRDNHADQDFEDETASQLVAIPLLESLLDQLDSLKGEGHLKQDVLIASLNVFGRTFKKKGNAGRDHNSGHHAMLLMGDGIKGGVVGGLVPNSDGSDYVASSIDSSTGAKSADGDIPFEETLASAGKTLAYALGVPSERVESMIDGGKVVKTILA
ncbi:MAG: DUF1501 domain-containing protein [Polyangiaceae bacterium]